ncbi:MAG TPA: alpha/beta hydrolase [Vicinamibacterales bacterium]|nr:alpha/beta hydrolase [Vicinamibacterales bacterium]
MNLADRRLLLPVAIGALLGLVLLVGWLVRRAEPGFAFFPSPGEDGTPQSFGVPFTAATVITEDGERLRVWHLPRADARAQVVYFHGNGGNLSLWADVLVGLWRQGFDVIGFDYRGYGVSTGSPTEQGLYRDTDAVLHYVHTTARRTGVPLLYWGRSLGTPMAAYAASRRAPDGVVLEAGFPSARDVLQDSPLLWALSFLSTYRFATADWMAAVRAPALVLHGDRDSVIPYHLGTRLYEALPGPKTFVTIAGGDHNDPLPRDGAPYWTAVHAFVAGV